MGPLSHFKKAVAWLLNGREGRVHGYWLDEQSCLAYSRFVRGQDTSFSPSGEPAE
jgi:hypothetical protein